MDTEQLKHIKKFCDSFDNPTALLTVNFECKYCNKKGFIKKDANISFVFEGITPPLKRQETTIALINGAYYSCRLTPLWDEWCFCEFLNKRDIMGIVEKSDLHSQIYTILSAGLRNLAMMWKNSSSLEKLYYDNGYTNGIDEVAEIKKNVVSLRASLLGISSYVDMLNPRNDFTQVDLYSILKSVIDRCNSRLSSIDRYIDFVSDNDGFFIYSSDQFVVNALVCVLQNALLYSKKDCVPVVTIFKQQNSGESYVVVRVVNDCALFIDEKFGETVDMNFCSQRSGLGIPTLRRFAEISKGSFSIEKKDDRVCVEIKIPEYELPISTVFVVESSEYTFYDCGIPDNIDSMLDDVIETIKYM